MVGILGVSKARLSKQYHFTISQPKGMELVDNVISSNTYLTHRSNIPKSHKLHVKFHAPHSPLLKSFLEQALLLLLPQSQPTPPPLK